jgi:hypothetical protein
MQNAIERILGEIEAGRFREAGAMVERSLSEHPQEMLPYRVNLANWLLLAANWPLITRLLPPGTNFFVESGWLESVLQEKPVSKAGAPIPWYTYPAIEFVEPRIRADFRVFEYGSGWSTAWWAQRVESVFAVEHDAKWFGMVESQLPVNARVSLRTDAERYIGELDACGGDFDIVVIDGEHRNQCARAAAARLKPSGAILFDNSDRLSFSDGVRYLSDTGWLRVDFFGLTPSYPYKACTSLFFRDTCWLSGAPIPAEQSSSIGPSCSQAIKE